jgi:hypothetical protein
MNWFYYTYYLRVVYTLDINILAIGHLHANKRMYATYHKAALQPFASSLHSSFHFMKVVPFNAFLNVMFSLVLVLLPFLAFKCYSFYSYVVK